MGELTLEPAGIKDLGPCGCCGDSSRTVWGFVYRGGNAEAAYFVHWTLGKVAEHGAHVDLILGKWGKGVGRTDRFAVSLEFRRRGRGPGFMLIDATKREIAHSELVGRGLPRDEVAGTVLAERVFEIVGAIWLQDDRLREVTEKAPRRRLTAARTRTRPTRRC